MEQKKIEYDEHFGCDVIVDEDGEYTHPDNEKTNKRTGEYSGTVNEKPVHGMMLQGQRAGFKFYYYTVD